MGYSAARVMRAAARGGNRLGIGVTEREQKLPCGMVVGGGPAGLMAAEVMAAGGMSVTVLDRMPSLGRKFLLAGRGGLNLTHSEPLERFLPRYAGAGSGAPAHLVAAVAALPPEAVRAWAEALGQPTFVGSSGRVFPRSFKTSPLLRAWLARLREAGVRFERRAEWLGWDAAGAPKFGRQETAATDAAFERPDALVLALGGASWPRLGSDGGWVPLFQAAGIAVTPLQAANCGVLIVWTPHISERFAGTPLKRIALTCGNVRVTGEAMVTLSGLEGGAIYALGPAIRQSLSHGAALLHLDLRPDLSLTELTERLARPRGSASLANHLRKVASLAPVAVALLREAGPPPADAEALAARIKTVPLTVNGLAPIARAISTAGGVAWDAIDDNFMLRARPGTFVAGEMLDWDAPTGGYLLQAAFATGAAAGFGALNWARGHDDHRARAE